MIEILLLLDGHVTHCFYSSIVLSKFAWLISPPTIDNVLGSSFLHIDMGLLRSFTAVFVSAQGLVCTAMYIYIRN